MHDTHTFGGHLLNRFIDYEAIESGDPGGAPAEAMPAVEAGADPAPPAAEPAAEHAAEGAPSSGEPEAPAWAGPSQDEWQALQDQNRQLLEWASQQNTPPGEDGPTDQQLYEVIENARLEGDVAS